MKYFFVHKESELCVKTLYNMKFKGDLNFLITEQELQEAINQKKIDNYDKILAFKEGDMVTLADFFKGEDEAMKKLHNAELRLSSFDPNNGTIKFEDGVTACDFYINDLKRI